MKRIIHFAAFLLAAGSLSQTMAADLPKSQPKVLTIFRECVKLGKAAEHGKFEVGYPAALEKAKSPDYYLALTSITGSSEAWYIQPNESFAEIGESMKREDKDPILSAELSRLALADTDYITSSQLIRAVGRPDLSLGSFPDISKARFFEISTFRVRPGKEMQFDEIAKVYTAVMKREAPRASSRIYQVIAGDRQPTYFIFTSMESYGELDRMMSEGEAAFKKATPEEMATLNKFSDVAESIESNHFRLDPKQSYVSKATRESDPEFWMPKN